MDLLYFFLAYLTYLAHASECVADTFTDSVFVSYYHYIAVHLAPSLDACTTAFFGV